MSLYRKRTFRAMLKVTHQSINRRSICVRYPYTQEPKYRSANLADRCYIHLKGLLIQLKVRMDWRMVQTFLSQVMVIFMHRHHNQGLLLSELGGYILNPDQTPAGTKRISCLLHLSGWSSEDIVNTCGHKRISEWKTYRSRGLG